VQDEAVSHGLSVGDVSKTSGLPKAILKVAVAQPLVVPGDVAKNLCRMEPLVAQAALQGAGLVLFSECGLTGYDPAEYSCLQTALALNDAALHKVAAMALTHRIVIVAGFYERLGEEIYNTAVAFYSDGRRVVQRKHHIVEPELTMSGAKSAPRERVIFEVQGVRCAILICSDSGMEGIYEELAAQGCHVILAPTAGCGLLQHGMSQADLNDPSIHERYLQLAESVCFVRGSVEVALKYGLALVACNQAGWLPELDYFHPGHSSIVDGNGEITALIPGRMIYEHLRPEVAVGCVHARL
jgi:predicted amidohydrolase